MERSLSHKLSCITGLYTDFYELVMAESYFHNDEKDKHACFDYFFRTLPFQSSYVVFAGLNTFLELLGNFQYTTQDLEYLRSVGFHESFLEYLKDFRFRGSIHAVPEGDIVFPFEPIIRVEGNIIETQLIETILLNTINYQSLVATKASRIRRAAGEKAHLSEFGLRRAPSAGGLFASRAAIIGGFDSTSNAQAAQLFGLKAVGTMAHSFVQKTGDELEAFRQFARFNPDRCILLVDTYDTLRSGLPNAIKVAREMERQGHRLAGIRLDSGDPAYLSRKARRILDEEGLSYVKIAVSNELDEEVIKNLHQLQAPIDFYGVGTNLVTGKPDAALDGVYKLSAFNSVPKMKLSDNNDKMNLPGIKTIRRYYRKDNSFSFDGVFLKEETEKHKGEDFLLVNEKPLPAYTWSEELMRPVMEKGRRVIVSGAVVDIAKYTRKRLNHLPENYLDLEQCYEYTVLASRQLEELRRRIINRYSKGG